MLPSITDLTYFYETALELNFSRTARKLNISQPALSIAIKRLESLLDTTLFMRHTQGLTLTGAGEHLFNKVQIIVAQWHDIAGSIKEVKECVKGKVTIGCHSTFTPFLSNMVANLLAQHEGLEINFQYSFTPEIMQNIEKGKVDIGITTDPYPHANLIICPIGDTEFSFWVSKKQNTKVDLYAKDLLVLCDLQIPPTNYLLNELKKIRGNLPQPRLSNMNQIEAIVAMTSESQGLGILPTCFTDSFYNHLLKKVPHAPLYTKPLCLAYRAENKSVLAVWTVLEAIKNLVKSREKEVEFT